MLSAFSQKQIENPFLAHSAWQKANKFGKKVHQCKLEIWSFNRWCNWSGNFSSAGNFLLYQKSLVSIPSTFYTRVFLYKILGAKISNPKASLVVFGAKILYKKHAQKSLVKSTPALPSMLANKVHFCWCLKQISSWLACLGNKIVPVHLFYSLN